MPKMKDSTIMKRARELGMVVPTNNGKVQSVGDRMAQTAQLAQITEREKALAMRVKTKRYISFKIKYELHERILAMAEKYEEDLAVIQRACLVKGLEYFEQWADSEANPFEAGRPFHLMPSQVDPTGVGFAQGVPVRQPFQRPVFRDFRPPQPRETIIETSEPVFSRDQMVEVKGKKVSMEGLLPSGATVQDEPFETTRELGPPKETQDEPQEQPQLPIEPENEPAATE